MRTLAAALLVVVAMGAAVLSWGALRNLFDDYQDSPTWTYLLFGLPWLVVAGGALAGAVHLKRRR
jgi:hypothetical protein